MNSHRLRGASAAAFLFALALGCAAEPARVSVPEQMDTATLINRLSSNDTREITTAVYQLARNNNTQAAPRIRELLAHPAPQVRGTAAQGLGMLRDEKARAGITRLLDDDDRMVRLSAGRGLLELGGPAGFDEITRRFTETKDAERAFEYFRMARAFRSERIVAPARTFLKSEIGKAPQSMALPLVVEISREIVGRQPQQDDIPTALKSSAAEERFLGLERLKENTVEPARIIAMLADSNLAVRVAAAQACARLGVSKAAPDLEMMIENMAPATCSPTITNGLLSARQAVYGAWRQLVPPVRFNERLWKDLREGALPVRAIAASMLKAAGDRPLSPEEDEEIRAVFLELLGDALPAHRQVAAQSLLAGWRTNARETLEARRRIEKDEDVRRTLDALLRRLEPRTEPGK